MNFYIEKARSADFLRPLTSLYLEGGRATPKVFLFYTFDPLFNPVPTDFEYNCLSAFYFFLL
jgi:hypothetical protein